MIYTKFETVPMAMLEGLSFRAKYFVGDAYYGKSVDALKRVKELGMVVVVSERDTMRRKVRVWEWPTGTVKNTVGDRDKVEDFHVASLYVLARFVIYNLALLEELLLLRLKLLGCITPSNSLSFNKMRIFSTAREDLIFKQ